MDATRQGDVTELLLAWRSGSNEALNELMPLVYSELRAMARRRLGAERPDHTFQPTDLICEAYLRLFGTRQVTWQNRAHFFALAAQLMRRVLIEHARKRRAAKRVAATVTLDGNKGRAKPMRVDVIAVHEALEELESMDPWQCKIVELRCFGGLSTGETAEALGLSPATIKREWRTARAWLWHTLKSTK
jgi:RNA polymerase sigma factor (TIGR02999 family)